jgi:uncharacterized membrane protein
VHFAPWFWFTVATLLAESIVGLLQKLLTNHISAESTLIWLVVGCVLLEPSFYPGRTVFAYYKSNVVWALLGGLLNTLGAWALFTALKCGGKASLAFGGPDLTSIFITFASKSEAMPIMPQGYESVNGSFGGALYRVISEVIGKQPLRTRSRIAKGGSLI